MHRTSWAAGLGLCGAVLLCATSPLADEAPKQARIVVYAGYGTPSEVVVRARVILDPAESGDAKRSALENVAANIDVLESDEVKFAPCDISFGGRLLSAKTDVDGLLDVKLTLAPRPVAPGVHPITISLGDKPGYAASPSVGQVVVLQDAPSVIVLSDFDDTVVKSHVTSKPRLLYEVLTKNAAQLEPVEDAAKAYTAAHGAGADAFFYLSGSPLQLHERIEHYLSLRGFPRGVIFLKNLGDDPLFAQLEYKVGRLEKILAAVPKAVFILVGDSGEKDPEIYAAVRRKHPDRVAAIVIRRAPGGDHAKSRFKDMLVVDDYRGKHDLIADLVRQARNSQAPKATPRRSKGQTP